MTIHLHIGSLTALKAMIPHCIQEPSAFCGYSSKLCEKCESSNLHCLGGISSCGSDRPWLRLAGDTVLLCIDTESLKSREIGIMYAKLVAERVLKRVSSTVYAVMAVDRSVSRWSDMFDMIGTIDPGGKFYLIVQEPAGERCVRPLTIKELARLQGFDISEVFTPAQLAQLIQVLPHRTMCKVLGQMYHVGAELAHFVAALCSVPRLHPRED